MSQTTLSGFTRTYYTFILRQYTGRPDAMSEVLYTEHDDHMHVIFQSSTTNSPRKVERIIEECGVPPQAVIEVKMTKQLVRNVTALIRYMKGRGEVVATDDHYDHFLRVATVSLEWPNCSVIPSEGRRMMKSAKEEDKGEVKRQKYIDLAEEVMRRKVRSMNDMNKKFTYQETVRLMADYGQSYNMIVRKALETVRMMNVAHQRATDYADLLKEELDNVRNGSPSHLCAYPKNHSGPSRKESIQWLEDMFSANAIAVVDFAITLRIIMNCEDEKINTLVLYGPTNTGKSLICKLMTSFLEHGSVMRRQEASAFAYENLLNRKVALMEEPKICAANQQDLKQILGGEPFEVHTKYQNPDLLERLPVVVTTNEPLGVRLSDVDAAATEGRCKIYTLDKQICNANIDETVPAPPYKLCACDMAHLLLPIYELLAF
ncbi:non capsid protein NS 1 [Echinococcus multilocularis]|uniref:Non capsid protein NS 1 n=3 Tax=Echinococcus multilocularis TaxID=6211 RepID=U6FUW9_ECHMU|nr:non capsid protein NS 1 [Echinococcus multilocularis]CDS35662.1 non capsid protein NS 1 [Echinococcus multilocularis]